MLTAALAGCGLLQMPDALLQPHIRSGELIPVLTEALGRTRDESRRLGLRIDRGKVLLPDVVHGAVHRPHCELVEVEQQILV